ncbi:membrane transporter protein [Trypanosoma rangeli]|uniref:Membrane transporter protein n=1 Tax=Trypanosoma rangeli TaxID=5698 RepID=A0A3R7L4I3_TRYRA|nr:membrane transporter protein [Trypanosoma rangeli]RNF07450.1 membrane transporter protein [Trypanosoma rangeli]|eukprot:RNF07450.1 membrane transporter protein [Trypanosoma rangeli]
MNIILVMFFMALELSVSATTIIGNSLGVQRYLFASRYARFILICDVALGVSTAGVMGYFGGHIARLYKNVPEMVSAAESIMPVAILCTFGDSFQYCLQYVIFCFVLWCWTTRAGGTRCVLHLVAYLLTILRPFTFFFFFTGT